MKKLKRFLSICMMTAIALNTFGGAGVLTSASETLGADLVSDGGFESAAVGTQIPLTNTNIQTGWFTYNAAEAVVSDTLAHDGQHAIKLTRDSTLAANKEMSLNYLTPLSQGKTYKLSAWVRCAPDFDGKGTLYIRPTDVDDFDFNNRGLVTGLTGDDDFVKIETVYAPNKDYTKARIQIGISTTSQSIEVYIDDISCVEVTDSGEEPEPEPGTDPEPIEGNLIENPGFETVQLPSNLSVANVNATRTTEEAHTGKYSYKMEQTKTYGAANYGKLPLEAGKTYYYAAWLRYGSANTVSTSFYIRLFWDGDDASATGGQILSPIVTGEDGWVFVESILTVPSDAKLNPRFNISSNPYRNEPVTFYIDDVVLKEITPTLLIEDAAWNQLKEQDGVPICPIDAAVTLSFNGPLRTDSLVADAVLLNGASVDSSKVTVTPDSSDSKKVTIRFSGLDFSKFYTLTLADNVWKDEYGRSVSLVPMRFKTSARVLVDSKKLYINDVEAMDGKLKNGTVRAEVSGLTNMSGSEENVTAILALFRNGEMVEISSNTVSVPAGGASGAKAEPKLTVNMDGSGTYVLKLFVWDDLKSGLSLSAETVLQ